MVSRKYISNILAQFFRYLLFYMKPDQISVIIYGIKDIPLDTSTKEPKYKSLFFKTKHESPKYVVSSPFYYHSLFK